MANYIDKIKKDGVEYDIHASNGGTKLYKHELNFSCDDSDAPYIVPFYVISTQSQPYVLDDDFYICIGLNAISIGCDDFSNTATPIISITYDGTNILMVDGSQYDNVSNFTDTVQLL